MEECMVVDDEVLAEIDYKESSDEEDNVAGSSGNETEQETDDIPDDREVHNA